MANEVAVGGPAHVVVAGGTPVEWMEMGRQDWSRRIETLLSGARRGGVRWITLLPHHGRALDDGERARWMDNIGVGDDEQRKIATLTVAHGDRYVVREDNGTTLIIDPSPDGHVRFAATVEALRAAGHDPYEVDEERLSHAILDPAVWEPDLVVILGPADVIPDSMVWELAYSELVFLDLGWHELTSNHLELAIDDFDRRHRRFGGLDS
jgi:undecaprenyl diphosphate synthase